MHMKKQVTIYREKQVMITPVYKTTLATNRHSDVQTEVE